MLSVHPNLPLTAAFLWLRRGWQDLRQTGMRGCFYGAIFTVMGYTIEYIYGNYWQATMGMTAGFFLMGPFICCGIYELSRQHDRGEPSSLWRSFLSFTRNWKSIAFFAVMLTFLMIIWARVSIVIFALLAQHSYPTVQAMFNQIASIENIEFLCVWAGVGCVFASFSFAISVVSMPILLDRNSDTLTAVFTSAAALWANTLTCLVWGLLIVAIVGSSLVIFKPLLVLTAPWMGHATWHAYKSMLVFAE